ncbi:hypothetical protein [Sphingomonas azotifigens]|uniref:hypothetical protein n=1 Tax=Sphingomonas azotifigens TaxID=330920 RepID=UPI00111C4600|nr:hypothetical protein [Sphingomonas azotifigens]
MAARSLAGIPGNTDIMIVGCLRTPHLVTEYPVSYRDVDADARFGAAMFGKMGVVPGSMVMCTSGSSEYAHFWPYQLAVESLEACVAIGENFIFDAGRAEMFMRRFPIKVAFGISDAILDGMAALNLDTRKAFAPAEMICARDGAADRLAALGFAPWRMVSLGIAFGFVSPEGETFYDRDEWLIEEANGELLITALQNRASPVVRLRTGVKGSVSASHDFTLH